MHVFAGPSLPADRARELLPGVVVHGPAGHLSLLELSLAPGDTVALVDGVFHQTAPIRHKELLHVIDAGVEVWGAGGMGALRAAELRSLGMRGVGIVYRLFALGALEHEDEVAVAHGPVGNSYRQTSDALVSIRVAARRSRRRRVIDRDVESALVATAAALPFARRRYETVARLAGDAGADRRQCAAFLEGVREDRTDVKRQDAERLLRMLAASSGAGTPASAPLRSSPRTWHQSRWVDEVQGEEIDGERVPDMTALAFCQAFARDYPVFHHQLALRAIVASAGTGGPRTGIEGLEAAALEAGRARGLLAGPEPRPNPALSGWLSEEELRLPARQASLRVLVRSYRQPPGVGAQRLAIDALDRTFVFAFAQRQVARARQLDARLGERNPEERSDRIPESRVREWFADLWGVAPAPDVFELAAYDRGFISNAELARRTRLFLPYARAFRIPAFSLGEEIAGVGPRA